LCLLKLAISPFVLERGLVGYYYSTPDLTGPVRQVRHDLRIDFTDGEVPLDFVNDMDVMLTVWPGINVLPTPDFTQMPFSVRWTGYIRGNQPRVETDQV